MTEHKAWNWDKATQGIWNEPCEEAYWLAERWKRRGFSRFLDLGCGIGRNALHFARMGFSVDAIDLSESGVSRTDEAARKEGLAVRALVGDMASLPYGDASFDCLLAFHVISHTDTAGVREVVDGVRRVLKPGGEFYITLCSKRSWSWTEAGYPRVDENTVRKVEDGPEDGIPHFYADEGLVRGLFGGFRVIGLRHIQDLVVRGDPYVSWHYFLHGAKP